MIPPDTRRPPHLEGGRDDGKGIYISKYPDVCKSPVCPVPYTIVAFESDDINTATSVRYTEKRAHNMGSLVSKCYGDEPGVGLGVKSGTVGSVCHHKEHSQTVRVEGKWAVRDRDEVWMNNKNTIGKIVRPGSSESFERTPPFKEYQVAQNGAAAVSAPAPLPSNPGTVPPKGPAKILQFPTKPQASPPQPAPEQRPPPNRWWTRSIFTLELALIAEAFRRLGRMKEMIDNYKPTDLQGRPIDSDSIKKDMMEKLGVKNEDELRALIERLKKAEEKTDAPPSVEAEPGVSVKKKEEEKERECKTGRYGSLVCDSGEQAHHIVADYTLRYGTRAEGIAGNHRIPGLPSFRDGPAVCLKGQAKSAGDEHGIAHAADGPIAELGGASGMAPISQISAKSIAGAIRARPTCAAAIKAEVAKQPSLNSNTMGRTTISPPGDWPPGSGKTP
jgi:Domain of unknown function (DUF4150)